MSDKKRIEKFMSYALRHEPEKAGVDIDINGWVKLSDLILSISKNGYRADVDAINDIVANSSKKRFLLSEDGLYIRASQGHSSKSVKLEHEEVIPPEYLFHGTATRFVESINMKGLISGSRHHVHLSNNMDTAIEVGKRHGRPCVFKVNAGEMHRSGQKFYLSDNGVYLTENVKMEFLNLL